MPEGRRAPSMEHPFGGPPGSWPLGVPRRLETRPWNVAVHLGDVSLGTWVLPAQDLHPFPDCGGSSWAARNNGLWKTTACRVNHLPGFTALCHRTRPPPPPLTFPSSPSLDLPLLPLRHCSHHKFQP